MIDKIKANQVKKVDPKDTFMYHVKTWLYWAETGYTCLISLRLSFYLAAFVPWLQSCFGFDAGSTDGVVTTFMVVQSFAGLVVPVNGILIDIFTKKFKRQGSTQKHASLKAMFIGKGLLSIITFIFSLLS